MLMMNLGGAAQMMPMAYPMGTARTGAAMPPSTSLPPTAGTISTGGACGYGYSYNNGVCMAQGCIDGRSQCVVMDGFGRTCSYDQLLAFQNQTGVPACGPAPALPLPPSPPGVPPVNFNPGFPVDVSPNPGTQIVATVPIDQLVPGAFRGIPRWALVVGGVSILAIVVALFVRR